MSLASVEIFPPSFEASLARVGSLSHSAYEALRGEIEDFAFEADIERCERLVPVLGLQAEAIGYLLAALDVLYGRIKNVPRAQSGEAIRRFVDDFDETPDNREVLVARLTELTTPTEKIEVAQKIRRLRTGFLENATAFSTFVDLRPDFAPDYESVRALVPIIQLMVSTDAEDVARQHVVFQLDERRLAGLKSVIENAEKKLNTLKAKGVEKLHIIFEKGIR